MSPNLCKIIALLLTASVASSIFPAAQALVETCDDLLEAAADLQNGDVTIYMTTFADILCDNFTTFNITQNHLRVLSEDPDSPYGGYVRLERGRFQVFGSAQLTWEPELRINGFDELQDVNGGAIYIHEGGRARFLDDLTVVDVGVRSVTDEGSDFARYQLQGGCVWTAGYLRVEGLAVFEHCEVGGGGESSPGPGGAIYVDEEGFVVLNGGVEISDVSIIDDEGNNGGGIYNKGTVNIRGESKFNALYAESAGAIYNAEGAFFRFKSGATVIFSQCNSFDGNAGSVYNAGYMKFSGAALFADGRSEYRGGAIVVGSSGELKIAEESVFFHIETNGDIGAPVYVSSGGQMNIPDTILFIGTSDEDTVCEGVYFEEGEACET